MTFEVRLLGSVEALANGRSLSLGGSKQRSVVAMLALHASAQRPRSSPVGAATSFSCWKTRSTLRGSSDSSSELGAKRNRESSTAPPRRALELWGGAPLADVASEPFAGPEIRRLEELHLRAIELTIDAELATGRHGEVIGTLEAHLVA